MRIINLAGLALAGICFVGGAMAGDPVAACGADEMQKLVGQNIGAIEGTFPEIARILPPNSVMTQDFRPDRVNVNLDEAGVIVRIWCG